jgi:hypothetical protein
MSKTQVSFVNEALGPFLGLVSKSYQLKFPRVTFNFTSLRWLMLVSNFFWCKQELNEKLEDFLQLFTLKKVRCLVQLCFVQSSIITTLAHLSDDLL